MTKQESKFVFILLGLVLLLVGSILLVGAISKLKYGGGFTNFILGSALLVASAVILKKQI